MAAASPDYNLQDLVNRDINELIDSAVVEDVLSRDPFIPVPGVLNFRDLGVYGAPHIRRNLVYRSGGLSNLGDQSKAVLAKDLGITLILNLRSETETRMHPEPDIDGIEVVKIPSTEAPQLIKLDDFMGEDGRKGYLKIYAEIMDIHRPSIRRALEHLRDGKGGLLFHCFAGKDRTGVLAAVIMGLAGCSDDQIANDYAMTRVGIEPHREALLGMLMQWNKSWTMETPGMHEFSQIKGANIKAVLEIVQGKYGGMEGYVKKDLGFSDEDIQKIIANLNG
ncbi:uncharacterized protein BDZ99DRAFT_388632 [Mytilinidion resinicola]|uniref:Tyrosine specific protein phosphatases domain-containing protein n=1 Tax=Mytilinidion resinicola TaxID=574789 RepID=A0A6A6YME2_9PEZI|nr:uncharacterized protein BDZ99DRAFT_388632 [Mytilinidion resinicola]KAF2809719.1 hypothetical protein BDZ99DRAFT_388632 [Mytilinidion resinicola]